MANTEMIDQLVSDSALKSLDILNSKLTSSYTEMEKLLGEVQVLSTELSKPAKNYIELAKSIEKVEKVVKAKQKTEQEELNTLQEKTKLQQKIIDLESAEGKEIEKLRIQLQEKRKEVRNNIKEEKDLSQALDSSKKKVTELNTEISKPNDFKLAETAESQLKRLTLSIETSKKTIENLEVSPNLAESLQKSEDGVIKFGDAVSEGNLRLTRINDAQNTFHDALDAGLITQEEYQSSMIKLDGLYEKNSQQLDVVVKQRDQEAKGVKMLSEVSSDAYNSIDASLQGYYKSLVEVETEIAVNKAQQKELDDLYKNGKINLDAYTQGKAALMVTENNLKDALKNTGDQIKYNSQIANSSVGSYESVSAQYALLKIRINQMSDAEKYNGYTKKELEAQSKSLYEEMSRLQKVTGKHQLDVGQYDKAMGDLTTTLRMVDPTLGTIVGRLQQITPLKKAWIKTNEKLVSSLNITARTATILQAALVGLVIGGIYLAIKAFKEWFDTQREARMTLEQSNNIMSKTADSAGNTLTTYEKLRRQWVAMNGDIKEQTSFLEKYRDELDSTGYSINTVNDADQYFVKMTEDVVKAIKLRAEAAVLADLAAEKYKEAQKKREEADIRATNPDLLDTVKDYSNLWLNNAAIFVEDLFGAGKAFRSIEDEANWAASKIAKEGDKLLDERDKLIDEHINKLNELANVELKSGLITKEEYDKKKKATEKAIQDLEKQRKAREKFFEQEKKLAGDNKILVIQTEAQKQKQIASNETESFENRLNAANKYSEELKKSIETSRETQLAEVKKQMDKLGLAEEQGREHIRMINQKADAEIIKLDKETSKLQLDIAKDFEEKFIKNTQDAISKRNNEVNQAMQKELILAAKVYEQASKGANSDEERKKITEDYQKQRVDIIRKYNQQAFEEEVSHLEKMVELIDISENEKQKIRNKIDTLRKKNSQEIAEFEIDQLEKSAEKMKGTFEGVADEIERILNDKRTKAIIETWSTIFDTVNMYYDMQISKIDELEKREQEYYDDKIKIIDENVEAGLMSEEEADARRRILEDTQIEREKQFDQQRKEMQRKQALWQKANSIVQATINTAVGVTAAAPNFVLMGIIAALGAVQIAMIASQQIPSYAEGTDYHKGGLARVGDGGRSEMVILPSGEIWKTPDTDTFVNLPRGTEVLPDYRKAMMAMSSHHPISYYDDDSGKMIFLNDEVLRNNTKEANNQLNSINRGINAIRYNNMYSDRRNSTGYRFRNNSFN